MKKAVKFLIPIVLILISVIIILFQNFAQSHKTICFSSTCIKAEVADSSAERAKGLMYRYSLSDDEGMLFIFDKSEKHQFWMKNTFIPLDIIWINKNFEVVDIQTAYPCKEEPCKIYAPKSEALYVLEVNANFAKEKNISTGNSVEIRN